MLVNLNSYRCEACGQFYFFYGDAKDRRDLKATHDVLCTKYQEKIMFVKNPKIGNEVLVRANKVPTKIVDVLDDGLVVDAYPDRVLDFDDVEPVERSILVGDRVVILNQKGVTYDVVGFNHDVPGAVPIVYIQALLHPGMPITPIAHHLLRKAEH